MRLTLHQEVKGNVRAPAPNLPQSCAKALRQGGCGCGYLVPSILQANTRARLYSKASLNLRGISIRFKFIDHKM